MDYYRHVLNYNIATMRYFGLWAPHPNSSGIFKLFYAFYNKIMLALVCIFAGTLVADLCTNYKDFMIVTDDGCFIAGISVVVFKLFNFQVRREKIEKLIDAIYDPIAILRCSSDKGIVTLVETFVLYQNTMVYFFSGLGTFLVAALVFLVPTENGELPIPARFPFDSRTGTLHHVAFVIQASAVTTSIAAIIAMDAMVLGLCKFTRLQYQVLASNFENCQPSSERSSLLAPKGDWNTSYLRRDEDFEIRSFVPFDLKEVNVIDDDFSKRFKTCIRHQQRLIRITDDVNEVFGSSMLFQLCGSSSMICLTGFQAVLGVKDSSNLIKFGLYLSSAFSQLLCWCWFGNELLFQSESMATSQWFSGWENETNFSSTSVLMIISLIRTRRPMELKAGSFYSMTMETFLAILKSSYSFFALLTTVNFDDLN